MKRFFSIGALFLCSLFTFAQYSGSGNGTEDDPYLIFNENQLSQMVNFLNQEGVVFKLMKDLNLSSWIAENNPSQGWLPVGVESSPFKGKFYGNNHTIRGLMINRTSTNNVGFFGYVSGATITDLTIEGTTVKGAQNVGGLVGYISGATVTNCHVNLNEGDGVTGTSYFVGGLAGYSSNTNFQTFSASTTVTGTLGRVGGIVGKAENGGTFSDGSFMGDLIGTDNHTGGLIGYAIGLTLTNIIVKGDISGKNYTGGIVACAENSSLNNCNYEGTLTGIKNVGGIVGALLKTTSTFTSCFSKGKITATGDYCGGVIGVSQGACIEEMESCSHFGDVYGNDNVGGLIGCIMEETPPTPTLNTYHVYQTYGGPNDPNWHSCDRTFSDRIVSGSNSYAIISNCTAIGELNGNNYVGGIIGSDNPSIAYTANPTVYKNNGYGYRYTINGEGAYWSGSGNFTYYEYVKSSKSTILEDNYYNGIINGKKHVGGIVGSKKIGRIAKCYSNSSIYGESYVGGIAGSIQGSEAVSDASSQSVEIKSCVANDMVVSASSSNVGRIYGYKNNNYVLIGVLSSSEGNRSLVNMNVCLQGVIQEVEDDLQNGTSTGPSLLRLKATYVSMGWNFDENWNIQETECFPYKKYQAAPPVIESNLVSQATNISGKSLNGGTVYLYYKDHEAVSTQCDGHQWTFDTEPLQSGALVQIYADIDGMTPSYFTTTNVGYPGSGTEDDPWRIYTAEDLQGACNRGYYKLMNDIDLTSWINENSPTKGWISVGRNSGEATYIDGDGHKVTGLWIEAPTENFTGLFSNFSAGQIKNLNVEVATGKKVRGADYTGILIGRNANGRLVNCSVKGQVEGTVHVGGVVGYAEATTISSITFDGGVKSTANQAFAGGVAGQMLNCTVTSCNAASTIVATGIANSVGGLMGQAKGGSISKSTAANTLSASGIESYVGGLIGYSETPVIKCVATGNVSAIGNDSYTGGLVGYTLAAIDNSYSTAKTTGTWFTGGLVGYSFNSIDKCYAKGDVYGSVYGGGVVGELDGANATLTNSVACNNILALSAQSSWGSRVIGGYKNGAPDPDESNYALSTMQVSLNNVPQTKTDDIVEGQARTAQQLMQAATYQGIGWDFSAVWGVDEGQMYPYLLWEIDVNPVADISFDKTSMLIAVGKTETISASVLPLGATNKRLNWTSSNTAVATVADGVVTAVAVGTAVITATSTDGSNISATCNVTVVANHDDAIAELQSIVDHAQDLYDNSTEGQNIGEYAAGARAELLAVINSVKARISSTMSDEAITECTNDINAAIELFESKKVTAGEDTNISQIANTIYIERTEAAAGQQIQLSVKMKNTVAVQGYQFDLYLPNGVTVAEDEDGFALAELSYARTTKLKTNYFETSATSDGGLRVLCGSTKGYTFSGNDGEVAIITLNISADINDGEHAIILKNIKLSDANSVAYSTDYVKSTLAISSYTLGDVNADGSVDVADFIAIANHILGNTISGFVEKAADVNLDNSIDVADFIGVANMILNEQAAGSRMKMPSRDGNESPACDALNDAIYIEPIILSPGRQQVLSVRMKNDVPVAGFEFTVQLPEGMTVATDADNMNMVELSTERTSAYRTNYFDSSLQADGTLKVLCGTSRKDSEAGMLYAFNGNDGEVARITVNVAAGIDVSDYPVMVKDAVLSTPDAQKMMLPAMVMTGTATGVNDLTDRAVNASYYDLQGRRVMMPVKKGLYILNGKKEVIR